MKIMGLISAILLLTAVEVSAQPAKQLGAKMICGPHTANPETLRSFQVSLAFDVDSGVMTATRSLSNDGQEVFHGIIAPSGEIVIIGNGKRENGAWNYEFHGHLGKNGLTVLKGSLRNTLGAVGTRGCSIEF